MLFRIYCRAAWTVACRFVLVTPVGRNFQNCCRNSFADFYKVEKAVKQLRLSLEVQNVNCYEETNGFSEMYQFYIKRIRFLDIAINWQLMNVDTSEKVKNQSEAGLFDFTRVDTRFGETSRLHIFCLSKDQKDQKCANEY